MPVLIFPIPPNHRVAAAPAMHRAPFLPPGSDADTYLARHRPCPKWKALSTSAPHPTEYRPCRHSLRIHTRVRISTLLRLNPARPPNLKNDFHLWHGERSCPSSNDVSTAHDGHRPLSSLPNLRIVSMRFVPPEERGTACTNQVPGPTRGSSRTVAAFHGAIGFSNLDQYNPPFI